MIVVGLLAHSSPPQITPDLVDVAHLVTAVNARQGDADPTPWLGFGANHNRLMDNWKDADWYVALNPDVDISADQLYTLIEEADRHGFALAAPLRRDPWGLHGRPSSVLPSPNHFLNSAFSTRRLKKPSSDAIHNKITDSAWVAGTCMAIRKDLVRELRFDERFFMYFEDVDFCLRARSLGARIGVCETIIVDHGSGWRRDDQLISNRGVEYARSARVYAELYGHSPDFMRAALIAWALPRTVFPGRNADEKAASRAISKGAMFLKHTGIAELALAYNTYHGFSQNSF